MKTTNQNSHTHAHTHTHTEERNKKTCMAGTTQQLSPITVGPQLKRYYKRKIRSKAAFRWLCQTPSYVAFGTN